MTPSILPADLAALLPPHHVGVPCETCAAPVGQRCESPGGLVTHRHKARERRAWHVRNWLYLHGIDANEAGS